MAPIAGVGLGLIIYGILLRIESAGLLLLSGACSNLCPGQSSGQLRSGMSGMNNSEFVGICKATVPGEKAAHGPGWGRNEIAAVARTRSCDRDGVKARGYLRKVEAWRRVTKVKSHKQALMLYNHLSGRAWRDAEELDLEWLDGEAGMSHFIDWVRNRYLEGGHQGWQVHDGLFKNLKMHHNQDVKEFNQEFDRQSARLKEVGCALPAICLAWWCMDKLRLENATELNLLSSTDNDYNLCKLQDAAIIQDRMNRRLWESNGRRHNDKHDYSKKGLHDGRVGGA